MQEERPGEPSARVLLDRVEQHEPERELRPLLERIVQVSCAVTGARYGFLGLIADDGSIYDFALHGVSPEQVARIASLPTGRGVLGVLVEDPRPLRLDDIAEHPRSVGFPAGHPPMRRFLGVPVRVAGEVFGNLYLTEKADGGPFTEHDAELLESFAEIAGFSIGSVRSRADHELRRIWLEEGMNMSTALQRHLDVDDAWAVVAASLRQAAGAGMVMVLRVQPADGAEAALVDLVAEELEEDWEAAAAAVLSRISPELSRTGVALAPFRHGDVAVHVVPMRSWLAPGHFLVVGVPGDEDGSGVLDELLTTYAVQAALAIDRTQALSERQEHLLVADRHRIARDLHDTVIQRIFATGLALQALRGKLPQDEARAALDEGVAELNTTIREIRTTIFDLSREQRMALSERARRLVAEYVVALGFTPFLRIRGAVDGLPRAREDALLATLRELLSNVARHAQARSCLVEVEVTGGRLRLKVSDDGRGIPGGSAESGLRNVRRRAAELDGDFGIARSDDGTVASWNVPVR